MIVDPPLTMINDYMHGQARKTIINYHGEFERVQSE